MHKHPFGGGNLYPDTADDSKKMKKKILRFCKKLRTHEEIKLHCNISGISAAAYLSDLQRKEFIKQGPRKGPGLPQERNSSDLTDTEAAGLLFFL